MGEGEGGGGGHRVTDKSIMISKEARAVGSSNKCRADNNGPSVKQELLTKQSFNLSSGPWQEAKLIPPPADKSGSARALSSGMIILRSTAGSLMTSETRDTETAKVERETGPHGEKGNV